MTLSAAAQDDWDYNVFDSQSAYLQSKNPSPGTKSGQVFVATGSIFGTRDTGRAWYEHFKKVLETAGFVESRLEQDLYCLHGRDKLENVTHFDYVQEGLQDIQ